MNIEEVKGLLYRKLHRELKDFTSSTMELKKEDIIGECFKINLYIILYECLLEEIEILRIDVLNNLVLQSNIIGSLYDDYLDVYGDEYMKVKQFIKGVIG